MKTVEQLDDEFAKAWADGDDAKTREALNALVMGLHNSTHPHDET